MNDMYKWEPLDYNYVPSDILKPGAWEIEYVHLGGDMWIGMPCGEHWQMAKNLMENDCKYRIRRPAGWEPSKCPTCGSEDKSIRCFAPVEFANSINPSAKVCDNPWHDEPEYPGIFPQGAKVEISEDGVNYRPAGPKPPTHEEKCENCRFWKLGSFPSECLRHAPIGIESGSGVTREWPTTHSYDWCGDYEPCSE